MWSLGVILYIMLCGYPPFYSETPSRLITPEMRRKILSGEFEFPEDDWQLISDSAKNIVRRCVLLSSVHQAIKFGARNYPCLPLLTQFKMAKTAHFRTGKYPIDT